MSASYVKRSARVSFGRPSPYRRRTRCFLRAWQRGIRRLQQIGRADFLCAFRHLGFSPFEGLERSQRTLNRLPEPRAVARTLENAEAVGAERLREVVERVNDLRLTAPEAFSSNLFKAVRHFVLRRKVKERIELEVHVSSRKGNVFRRNSALGGPEGPLKAAGEAARASLFRRPALLDCPALRQGSGQSAQTSSAARRVRTASAFSSSESVSGRRREMASMCSACQTS